ncbi:hypothetical protein HK405_001304, partial [Cladochytrium tenue]
YGKMRRHRGGSALSGKFARYQARDRSADTDSCTATHTQMQTGRGSIRRMAAAALSAGVHDVDDIGGSGAGTRSSANAP